MARIVLRSPIRFPVAFTRAGAGARRRRFDRSRRLSRRAARFGYARTRELSGAAATELLAAGRRHAPRSRHSLVSVLSYRSAASVLSSGSILSVGSAGSVLSAGSILSFASAGSLLSIGSTGSILCIGSTGSVLSVGRTGVAPGTDEDAPAASGDPAAATVHRLSSLLAVVALGAAVLRGS